MKRVVTVVTQLIICDSAFSGRRRIPNQYLTVKRFNVQFEQKINEKASENKKRIRLLFPGGIIRPKI